MVLVLGKRAHNKPERHKLTILLTGVVRSLAELADEAGNSRLRETFNVFAQAEQLMMVIRSTRPVGESFVCVPMSGQMTDPNVTVKLHPSHSLSVVDLLRIVRPEVLECRSRELLAMKGTVVNPKFSLVPEMRRRQKESVRMVAQLVATLVARPIEVRFRGADGHNFCYLSEVVSPNGVEAVS